MSQDTMSKITNFFQSQTENESIRVGDPQGVEKFYLKLKEHGYNLDELQDILDCDDNMLIVSGAGSGKTTTLLLKIIRDILSGKLLKLVNVSGVNYLHIRPILVSTFLKSGAEELSQKFTELCKKFNIIGVSSSQITFRTIHSEVYNALVQMGVKIDIVQDTNEYIREACKAYKIHSLVSKSSSKNLTNDELSDLSCILSYARNRLDDSRYNHPLMNEYNLDEISLKGVIELFNQLKALDKVQDFEDLEEILYDGYQRFPNVLKFIKSRYDYIYVDEFQDTSQLQYAILKPYFDSAKGFLCLGDDDQCIYSWRGSDVSLIHHKFEEDYKPVVKKLTINRRCTQKILKAVIPSIEKNTTRHIKKLKAANDGGNISVIVDGGVNFLTKSIKEDLGDSTKIGILGRTNADLLIPAVLLLIEGYTSFSVSKSVSLSDRIPSQVLGVMNLITQRYTNDFVGYFKLFLSKYNSYQASKLCDILSTSPDYSIYTLPLEDIRYSAPDLFPLIRMLRQEVKVDPVKAYVSLLEIMEQDVYNGKTIYAQRARDFTYYIRKIILEHESLKGKTIEELSKLFLDFLPKELEDRKPKRAIRKQNEKGQWVTEKAPVDNYYTKITTVHEAKGKEWDYVYIWNDVNGCFPNSVGNRELTKEEFEEERRVHYIAWTRAVKKLVVFTRSDRQNGFLDECDLSEAEIIEMNEVKTKVRDINKFSSKEVFRAKSDKTDNNLDIQKVENLDVWKDSVKEYVLKYTSYSYICSSKGSVLDACLTKLGGYDKLIEFLEGYKLESYPKEDLETVISDILEQYFNTL